MTVSAVRRGLVRWWRDWVRSLLVVVLLATSFRSAVADWNDVPSGSMRPSILEGDRIVVNKLAYGLRMPFTTWRLASWADPERGDIIVLLSPQDGKRLVKRVVGLPGDTLEMRAERLVVNGEPLSYSPLEPGLLASRVSMPADRFLAAEDLVGTRHPIMITPRAVSRSSFTLVTVPAGSYFVMGDNRDESFDSRYFGFVDRGLILGRAVAVAGSVDPSHHFAPRWQRFCRELK
jgi:signal peptidase I